MSTEYIKKFKDFKHYFKMQLWIKVRRERRRMVSSWVKTVNDYFSFSILEEFKFRINSGMWLYVEFWSKFYSISLGYIHNYIHWILKNLHSLFFYCFIKRFNIDTNITLWAISLIKSCDWHICLSFFEILKHTTIFRSASMTSFRFV